MIAMRRFLILLLFIAGLASAATWAGYNNIISMEHKERFMTDEQLKAKIDSLSINEEPLTAAPFIAEAKRRATATHDTRWMLNIIRQEINLNVRRLSRDSTTTDMLLKAREDAWSPLKQFINLELYLRHDQKMTANDILDDPDTLYATPISAIINSDDDNTNALTLIAISLASNVDRYDSESIIFWHNDKDTSETTAVLYAPMQEFISSTCPLPLSFQSIRSLAQQAATHSDKVCLTMAQILRIMLVSSFSESEAAPLIEELNSLTAGLPYTEALNKTIQAYAIVNKAFSNVTTSPDEITQINTTIATAEALAEEAKAVLEDTPFDQMLTNLLNGIQDTTLSVSTAPHVMPNKYVPVYLEYRNIKDITLRVFSNVDREQVDQLSGKKLAEHLSKCKEVCTEHIELPSTRVRLRQSSATLELDGLPVGYYVIAAYSKDSLLSAFQFISSQIAVNQISDNSDDYLLLTDYHTGRPIEDADYKAIKKSSGNNDVAISKAHSDKDGWLKVDFSGSRDVTISKDGDIFKFSSYSWHSHSNHRAQPQLSCKILTDRNIYRPGQTIMFKAFIYMPFTNYVTPIKESAFTIILKDSSGKEIATSKLSTDSNGATHGSLQIPIDAMKGSARLIIETNHKDATTVGSNYIRIEDFKRTDNTVTIDPFNEAVLPGANVSVTGSAMSAAGLPVANATVKYKVVHMGNVHCEGTTTTDSNGRFSFPFTTEEGKEQYFSINVRMTDLKGETATANRNFHTTEEGTDIQVGQTKNLCQEGQQHLITLTSVNSNGQPYETTLHLKLTPYEHAKPLLPCAEQKADTILTPNMHTVPMYGAKVNLATKPVDSRDIIVNGTTSFDIKDLNLKPGKYQAEVTAKALNGANLRKTIDFTVIAESGTSPNLDYLDIFAPDDANSESSISVKVCTGVENGMVHVLFIRQGKIEQRQAILASCGVTNVDYVVPKDAIEGETLKIAAMMTHDGRQYETSHQVTLHHQEKSISLTLSSFKDYSRPGAREEWTLTTDSAEAVVVSLYDSRLDKYVNNEWNAHFKRQTISNDFSMSIKNSDYPGCIQSYDSDDDYIESIDNVLRSALEDEAFCMDINGYYGMMHLKRVVMGAPDLCLTEAVALDASTNDNLCAEAEEEGMSSASNDQPVVMRENFSETVCFMPELKPSHGLVTFDFTLPDNLTTYNFRAMAYDSDLHSALVTHKLIVAKPINVRMGTTRFLVEQDTITLSADITIADTTIKSATATINVTDNTTGNTIATLPDVNLSFTNGVSQQAQWSLSIPIGIESLRIDVIAKADNASDGERRIIPIERRFREVNESHTFSLTNQGQHTIPNPFTEGVSKCLTFSYTSNAFIEVLRSLPSLDKNWTPCTDTYLGRFESSAIAAMLSQKADIQKAVDYLRATTTSNNSPSRIADADHTPWLYMANNLRNHDKEVLRIMSGNYAQHTNDEALTKLADMQLDNGSFPWFKGMDGNDWMTVAVAETLGEMIHLGLADINNPKITKILKSLLPNLNSTLDKSLEDYKKKLSHEQEVALKHNRKTQPIFLSTYSLSALHAQLLLNPSPSTTTNELLDILSHHWQYHYMTDRVTAASVLTLGHHTSNAATIINSLEENLVQTNDNTAYIPESGLFRRRAQIEAQAMLIITLQRLNPTSPNLPKLINHLILMKRGEAWEDAQSTSHALLALLASCSSLEAVDTVSIANHVYTLNASNPKLNVLIPTSTTHANVTKDNETLSWGSWQRTLITPKDKMPADNTDKLSIQRTLRVLRTVNGQQAWMPLDNETLTVGDELEVQLTFYNDEPLSFVRIRDFRAASLEPVDKLSGYRGWWWWRWSNADIPTPPHYMMFGDSSTEFFIDYLNSGKHSITYHLTLTTAGNFAAGYADATCMFCTEISAHSEGSRLNSK